MVSKKYLAIQFVLGLAAAVYVAGAHTISSWSNFLEELDGAVMGIFIALVPFAMLTVLGRSLTKKGFLVTAILQFALSATYFIYAALYPDPQMAIAYLVYVIPLQIISVIISLFVAHKN